MLGTFVEISVIADSSETGHSAIDDAFITMETIGHLMSVHSPTSELSILNRCAHRGPISVSWQTALVIRFSKWLHHHTNGAFDISTGTSHDIDCFPQNQVYFRRPLQIDVGGIAKGFAVDQAIATVCRHPISGALVNAGGDIRLCGDWKEAIWLRQTNGLEKIDHMPKPALATSSPRTHRDGRTRLPVKNLQTISVWASTCLVADALTKVVSVLGELSEPVLEHLEAVAYVQASMQKVA